MCNVVVQPNIFLVPQTFYLDIEIQTLVSFFWKYSNACSKSGTSLGIIMDVYICCIS